MNLSVIQQESIHMLRGFQAHMPLEEIIKGFPANKINEHIDLVPYTPWEIVEHMRLAQHDILDYIKNPDYQEPVWPDDYWPPKDKTATVEDWNNSVKLLFEDLKSLEELVRDPETDLTSPLIHNSNHTLFREIRIVGNHNSYHGGQLLIFKRVLNIY